MAGKKLMSRFALLLVHIALFAALVDASHFNSRGRRSGMHRSIRRADTSLSPNAPPQCQRRNHFKKLREAQAAVEANLPGGASNETLVLTLSDGVTTVTPLPTSTAESSGSAALATSEAPSSSKPANDKPTSTSSSEAPTKTPPPPIDAPAEGGILGQLFPVGRPGKSWSTSPEAPNALSLSDATFQPFSVLRSIMYKYSKAPDGKQALQAHYPKGSYTFTHSPLGGFSFYAKGPEHVDLTQAKEATFGYRIYFPEGFQFNRGGKLPGLYGGDSDDEATSCSGGRRSDKCFSARLMWRSDGDGEFYTYLPPGNPANEKLCNIPPFSECNETYGASVGRGAFNYGTGGWTTVSQRVRLNDVGQANGELQLWVNGKSVINVKGLVLRARGAGRIRGMQAQTFFGGSSSDWASPKDQDAYFSDFSVAITEFL